jgi:hypothetical protein
METLIGFIAGYLVGTREGKAGLARLRESVDSIRRSPEVRRLAVQAITVAESVAREAHSRRGDGLAASVARNLADRVNDPHAA